MNAANEKKVVKAMESIATSVRYLADGIRSMVCIKPGCYGEKDSPHDYCDEHVK